MDTLAPAWQPDLPVSDEVEQAMRELADEVEAELIASQPFTFDAVPYLLIPQAY